MPCGMENRELDAIDQQEAYLVVGLLPVCLRSALLLQQDLSCASSSWAGFSCPLSSRLATTCPEHICVSVRTCFGELLDPERTLRRHGRALRALWDRVLETTLRAPEPKSCVLGCTVHRVLQQMRQDPRVWQSPAIGSAHDSQDGRNK